MSCVKLSKNGCAKEFTPAMFSGKWKTVVLCNLHYHGPYRFNELMGCCPKYPTKC
jgi:DNA-binding HxlR family transcriptional regulator